MKDIVIYDGDCAMCNFFAKIILKYDTNDIFYITSRKSAYINNNQHRHNI